MEQTLPLSGAETPCKVRVGQTVAAVLFAVWLIWKVLSELGLLQFLMQQDVLPASPVAGFVILAVARLFPVVGFALLIPGAANRATKTATVLLSAGSACLLLCMAACALMLLTSEEITDFQLGQMYNYVGYADLAYAVVSLFAFSVILRGNAVEAGAASWIGLLLVSAMILPVVYLFNFIAVRFMGPGEHPFGSLPGTVFWVVWDVLLIGAYIRFARCTAFSGAGADAPQGVYSPLNKYMAGIVVASGVTLAVLWAVYRFAAPWLRML